MSLRQELTDRLIELLIENQRDIHKALVGLADICDDHDAISGLSGPDVAGVLGNSLRAITESNKRVLRASEELTAGLEQLPG